MAPRKQMKDYSEDDSTHTLMVITDVTDEGCVVDEREYRYVDENNKTQTGVEITLECPALDDQVLRSLEDLADECHGEPEFDV